jgi:hypothetical protein
MKMGNVIVAGIGAVVACLIHKTTDSDPGSVLEAGNTAFAGAMVAAILYGILRFCINKVKRSDETNNAEIHVREQAPIVSALSPSSSSTTQTPKTADDGDVPQVKCRGCGDLLRADQVRDMLGRPEYGEWCREGYCSVDCFQRHGVPVLVEAGHQAVTNTDPVSESDIRGYGGSHSKNLPASIGTHVQAVERMTANTDVSGEPVDPNLVGIGGWLILPAIGLVLSSIVTPIGLVAGLVQMDGRYAAYSVPSLLVNAGFCLWIWCATARFFGKSGSAPDIVIELMAWRVIASLVLFVLGLAVVGGDDALKVVVLLRANNFVAQGIAAAIWIPYFRVSRRVKATFVE